MDRNTLIAKLQPLYDYYGVELKPQRRGCKKGGHYKVTKLSNGAMRREIVFDQTDNQAAQIYVLIHETTHLVHNHPFDRSLTSAQKEVVADQVSKHFIVKWDLIDELKSSAIYNRLNLFTYSQQWLNQRQFSHHRSLVINDQITKMIDLINTLIKENDEDN